MSTTAQEAFEKYYDRLDPYGPNRGTQQIFIDGFNAGSAQLAALKEENEKLKDKLSLEKRMTSAMGEEIAYKTGEEILLKARVAALETVLADNPHYCPSCGYWLKEPANEGGRDAS